jgi:hypothetical protein
MKLMKDQWLLDWAGQHVHMVFRYCSKNLISIFFILMFFPANDFDVIDLGEKYGIGEEICGLVQSVNEKSKGTEFYVVS